METLKRYLEQMMERVKPLEMKSTTMSVMASPTIILRLWLCGFQFENIKKMISIGSQLKSGEHGRVESIFFVRDGNKLIISSAPSFQNRHRAEQLLKKLISLLSKRSAKEISTL